MPRKRRHWVPGVGAHTISRFVDRRFVLSGSVERRTLLESIGLAQWRWDWKWLSFALMSSHLHEGHIAGRKNPDPFHQSVHTRFAIRFHKQQQGATLGPVFAERPTIHPVRSRRALQRMVAYHHRNPPDAGVVERPRDSRWTSHRFYLRLEPPLEWLDVEWALSMLGFEDTEAGRRRFDEFVTEVSLDPDEFGHRPRQSREAVLRSDTPAIDWRRLVRVAREVVAVDDGVPTTSRRRDATAARWLVATIATRDLGQTYGAVADALGMSTGGVFNLLRRKKRTPELEQAEAKARKSLLRG